MTDVIVNPEPTVVEPPQQMQMQMPLPGRPLPLTFLFALVPLGENPVIMCTAMNDSGAMVQGYFPPDVALKVGKDLLKYGRAAFEAVENQKHLIVATKGPLLLPNH
jgi:hypothetical protein